MFFCLYVKNILVREENKQIYKILEGKSYKGKKNFLSFREEYCKKVQKVKLKKIIILKWILQNFILELVDLN